MMHVCRSQSELSYFPSTRACFATLMAAGASPLKTASHSGFRFPLALLTLRTSVKH